MFFRKKREEKESKEIVSPLNGKLFPIETVQDDVFAPVSYTHLSKYKLCLPPDEELRAEIKSQKVI